MTCVGIKGSQMTCPSYKLKGIKEKLHLKAQGSDQEKRDNTIEEGL